MALTWRFKFAAFALAALACIAGAFVAGERLASTAAQEASDRQLQIISLDLESILERYEALPFALTFQPEAAQALQQPDAQMVRHLNQVLSAIQQQAKVAAIYLMDPSGKTLATSNWDTPQSYIGKNFGFRPYFLDAMQGKAGRFYGIGSTTAEPGYFISQPVYPTALPLSTAKPIGVITIKISLGDFARTWNSLIEPVTLSDRWGVIFLSNRPAWQYHSIDALSLPAQKEIVDTLQYTGHHIDPVRSLPTAVHAEFGPPIVHSVGRLGWQLMTFPNQALIARSGLLWALTASMLLAISTISFWAVHQRKRRLEERGLARLALQNAAEDLDRKLALRTEELTSANQSLNTKYAKLKEAEHLLRATQDELIQAGKLTMLGQMAVGMTHELNQPLTAIRAFSDNAMTFLSRGQADRALENLTHISAASERMGAIIGQMKGFARKSDSSVVPVDLAHSISSSAHLLESEFHKNGCSLAIDIQASLQVMGDAMRIEQVLINLLRNALDAAAASEKKSVRLTLSREADDALIRICDSGSGIPAEVAARLFEPFFTTKPHGKGLGLGLVISSSIVQAMNGRLKAQNRPGEGAEFSLHLPLTLRKPE
ncbi:MAG: ATP-binding protein [Rhodoferax sp.]|uniref:sensor histidine kinase n=1 Tax=Rhodoferax sp. TaxID=50421 RepID=UPI003017A94D